MMTQPENAVLNKIITIYSLWKTASKPDELTISLVDTLIDDLWGWITLKRSYVCKGAYHEIAHVQKKIHHSRADISSTTSGHCTSIRIKFATRESGPKFVKRGNIILVFGDVWRHPRDFSQFSFGRKVTWRVNTYLTLPISAGAAFNWVMALS